MTIFDLLSAYHASLDNMKAWLDESDMSLSERVGIADAWQSEMASWFAQHGYCFSCSRALERCRCSS